MSENSDYRACVRVRLHKYVRLDLCLAWAMVCGNYGIYGKTGRAELMLLFDFIVLRSYTGRSFTYEVPLLLVSEIAVQPVRGQQTGYTWELLLCFCVAQDRSILSM